MKKRSLVKRFSMGILCIAMLMGNVSTSYAARTVKLVGTSGGIVKAVYATSGNSQNGYHTVDKSKVIISYTPPGSYEDCSDMGLTHFGLATDITKATTDPSETQIYPGAGWTCNGHTSSGAEWVHYFAAATVPASLQKDAQITKTLTVSLEDYKKASYIWGGPGLSEGDGVKNNKYGWVMTYSKIPGVNQIEVPTGPDIDEDGPELSANVKASGTTAAAANGKIWGTSATITATAKDNKSSPKFIDLYFGGSKVGGMASNPENAKTITGSYVVTTNGLYKIYSEDQLKNFSELEDNRYTNVDCIDLTPPTIQGLALDSQAPAKSHTLTVTATDSAVGLAAQAYSWDNGATWTSSNQKTVTANGSYTVKVRDKLGNASARSINVNNIDSIPPVIGEIKAEPDGTTAQDDNGKTWGTKGILTVNATDEGLGLADQAYSWDNGATWTEDNTLTVTENKEYEATVRDKADNRDSKKAVVDFVDLVVPKITDFSPNTQEWAQSYVLTVTAVDQESGLADEAYSYDGGKTWTADNTLTITENGTYKVIVRDRVGNGNADDTEKDNIEEIIIETIDTTPPKLEQSQTPTEWTNDCVRLDVKAVDEGSGLADQAYSWDGGKSWTTESSHIVEKNGNYSVVVRDKADNRATANYQVTNIDKVKPKASMQRISPKPSKHWITGNAVLKVTAKDTESGLADQAYSWDGGKTWQKSAEKKISKGGTYTVVVRDKAGNKTITNLKVNKMMPEPDPTPKPIIPEVPDDIKPDPTPKPFLIVPQPKPTPVPVIAAEEPKQEKLEKEEPEKIIETKEEPEPEPIEIEIDRAEGSKRKEEWKPFKMFERIMASLLKALFVICLLFLIFLFFRTIPVYGLMEEDSYKLLGRALIKKKKEAYFVKVSKRILEKGDTSRYKLRFGKNFANRKEDEALTIQLPEEQVVNTVIKRDVPFEYSE